jgi:hypothetical protein
MSTPDTSPSVSDEERADYAAIQFHLDSAAKDDSVLWGQLQLLDELRRDLLAASQYMNRVASAVLCLDARLQALENRSLDSAPTPGSGTILY